jgi:hypothetical protein
MMSSQSFFQSVNERLSNTILIAFRKSSAKAREILAKHEHYFLSGTPACCNPSFSPSG